MTKLVCDVCGGNLQMDTGGKTATCQCCGMQYSIERMREKIQEIRGTVKVEGSVQTRQTGTTEDVEQWRTLMHKYLEAGDYKNAYDMIGKIMQAVPFDEECENLYPLVREYLDLEITHGSLHRYNGNKSELVLPDGIKEISAGTFKDNKYVTKVVLPDSVEKICDGAFRDSALKTLVISPNSNLSFIGTSAFMNTKLNAIYIPASLTELSEQAFYRCPIQKIEFAKNGKLRCIGASAFTEAAIETVTIPDYVQKIDSNAFGSCYSLKTVIFENEKNIQSIGDYAFAFGASLQSFPQSFPNLKEAGKDILNADIIGVRGPTRRKQEKIFGNIWKSQGRCPSCGSKDTRKTLLGVWKCQDCKNSWS